VTGKPHRFCMSAMLLTLVRDQQRFTNDLGNGSCMA